MRDEIVIIIDVVVVTRASVVDTDPARRRSVDAASRRIVVRHTGGRLPPSPPVTRGGLGEGVGTITPPSSPDADIGE